MNCRHAIVYCPLEPDEGLKQCSYRDREKQCPLARAGGCLKDVPTFSQCVKIYLHETESTLKRRVKEKEKKTGEKIDISHERSGHAKIVVGSIRNSLAILGLKMESRVTVMTDVVFDELVRKLKDKGFSDETVKSRLFAFKSISSTKLKTEFRKKGLKIPNFEIPTVDSKRKIRETATRRQKLMISDVMSDLRRSTRIGRAALVDRNIFIAMWFMRNFALRNGDVERMKWENIVKEDGGYVLKYTPHKTEYSTGCVVDYWISPEQFDLIEPYMKSSNPTEYCLINAWGRSGPGVHGELWRKVNRFMRSIGFSGSKGAYNLRRIRLTEEYERGGAPAERKLGCHRSDTFIRNYEVSGNKYRPSAAA